MRRAAKTDANQLDIVHALLDAGCTVTLLHRVGDGCPDLLVGRLDKSFAVAEVKDGTKAPSRRRLTPEQEMWHAAHEGFPVYVVSSVEEALSVMILK